MHITTLLSALILCFLCSGCDLQCFGPNYGYSSELEVEQPFQPIRVAANDSTEFIPYKNLEVFYFYTDSDGCGDDYHENPSGLSLSFQTDSIASYSGYWSGGSHGKGDFHYVIHGIKPGNTIIDLEVSWIDETTTDDIRNTDNFEIALEVY